VKVHIGVVARDPRLLAVERAREHVVGVVFELLIPSEEVVGDGPYIVVCPVVVGGGVGVDTVILFEMMNRYRHGRDGGGREVVGVELMSQCQATSPIIHDKDISNFSIIGLSSFNILSLFIKNILNSAVPKCSTIKGEKCATKLWL